MAASDEQPAIVEWVLKTHRPLFQMVMKHLSECRGCSEVTMDESLLREGDESPPP